jgi:hypothetical protein
MDELVIADQKYISSKRAAEITGYAKDYIGQLCREGRVESRLVGRSWYVREAAIRDHRFGVEKAAEKTVETKPEVGAQKTWESPTYTSADSYADIPRVTVREVDENDASVTSRVDEKQDLAAKMQDAWRSWFTEPHAIDTQYVDESIIEKEVMSSIDVPESVSITKIENDEDIQDAIGSIDIPIEINRSANILPEDNELLSVENNKVSQDRVETAKKHSVRPNFGLRAILVSMIIIVWTTVVAFAAGILNITDLSKSVAALGYISGTSYIGDR